MSLHLDFETRSPVDIQTAGGYVYANHPDTLVLLASFMMLPTDTPAFKAWTDLGGPVEVMCRWSNGQPCPRYLAAYIQAGGEIVAHNAGFERLILQKILHRQGWPYPKLEQFRCVAATAAAMALPRSLDKLGKALGLEIKKDKVGWDLMKIHSIPRSFTEDGQPVWHPKANDPESLARYHQYCDTDVLAEIGAYKRLVPLSKAEMEVYWLNERINDRGLRVDLESAHAAIALVAKARAGIDSELSSLTRGAVTAVTQGARLLAWLKTRGVDLPSLEKEEVELALHEFDDLPDDARRALELRFEGAKPSTDKIKAMLTGADADGRARGCYLHHGAGATGRFSARRIQVHNMPKYRKVFEEAKLDLGVAFDIVRTGDPAELLLNYGPDLGRPLHIISDLVRSFLWAAPGHDFIAADYSSIEGRFAAWSAGEVWKVQAYEALDRGEGEGIYELMAASIYGVPVGRVTKKQRQTGKVAELSCGYQTGAGGIRRFARSAGIKLHELYPPMWESADLERRKYVEERFKQRVAAHDPNVILGREGWIAAELIKLGWRAKHPMITKGWGNLEDAAVQAVQNPGTVAIAQGVEFLVAHGFLWARLRSGRCLAYGSPRMDMVEAPWADKTLEPAKRERKLSITARRVDGANEQWGRYPIYGGMLFNNIVQGQARDILVHGMQLAEAAGYPVVLHTHDEIAAEVPHGFGDLAAFEKLICDLPNWAAGLPMTAKGWRGKRYRKD